MLPAQKHMDQMVLAYPGTALTVTDGANIGDSFSVAGDLCVGDCYELCSDAIRVPVRCFAPLKTRRRPSIKSGSDMVLDCHLILMNQAAETVGAMVYASLDAQGCVNKTHVSTTSPLRPGTPYTLIEIIQHS